MTDSDDGVQSKPILDKIKGIYDMVPVRTIAKVGAIGCVGGVIGIASTYTSLVDENLPRRASVVELNEEIDELNQKITEKNGEATDLESQITELKTLLTTSNDTFFCPGFRPAPQPMKYRIGCR